MTGAFRRPTFLYGPVPKRRPLRIVAALIEARPFNYDPGGDFRRCGYPTTVRHTGDIVSMGGSRWVSGRRVSFVHAPLSFLIGCLFMAGSRWVAAEASVFFVRLGTRLSPFSSHRLPLSIPSGYSGGDFCHIAGNRIAWYCFYGRPVGSWGRVLCCASFFPSPRAARLIREHYSLQFFHHVTEGRPGLALDVVEELRPDVLGRKKGGSGMEWQIALREPQPTAPCSRSPAAVRAAPLR